MSHTIRTVGLQTIVDLLKQRPLYLIAGLIITLGSFAVGSLMIFLSLKIGSTIPDIDYDLINEKGKEATAVISGIRTRYDITINDEHPSIIHFIYPVGKREVYARYHVFAPDVVEEMVEGDSIDIKYYGNKSIIVGLKPLSFLPTGMLIRIMAIFFTAGITILVLLFLKVRKQVALYRDGIITNARVLSMTSQTNSSIFSGWKGMAVRYEYTTTLGQAVVGESLTKDLFIFNTIRQGDIIKIFVSHTNEAKSCMIPRLEEVRNGWKIE